MVVQLLRTLREVIPLNQGRISITRSVQCLMTLVVSLCPFDLLQSQLALSIGEVLGSYHISRGFFAVGYFDIQFRVFTLCFVH
jgi:hypothetical protein